ncbi:MAG: hypothetical protein AAGI52_08675 [Bacteroidota bacterium]
MRALLLLTALLVAVPAALAQPRSAGDIRLVSVTVDETLDYQFEVDDAVWTLSYASPQRGVGVVRVTDKGGNEVLAVRQGQRTAVRINGRRVVLRDGQSLYEVEGVEPDAVWLVEQNVGASRSIGTGWLQEITAGGSSTPPATQRLWRVPDLVGDIIGGIVGGGSGGGGGCSSSETSCTEEDVNGNSTIVTHRCSCGVAFCTTQQFTVEVPVVVAQANGSTEVQSEQRSFTRCLCGCLKLAENRR